MKLYQSSADGESVELDSIDLGILDLLQDNCKQSLAQIGEKVGLKAPSVLERIHKLEEVGVVTGSVPVPDRVRKTPASKQSPYRMPLSSSLSGELEW